MLRCPFRNVLQTCSVTRIFAFIVFVSSFEICFVIRMFSLIFFISSRHVLSLEIFFIDDMLCFPNFLLIVQDKRKQRKLLKNVLIHYEFSM